MVCFPRHPLNVVYGCTTSTNPTTMRVQICMDGLVHQFGVQYVCDSTPSSPPAASVVWGCLVLGVLRAEGDMLGVGHLHRGVCHGCMFGVPAPTEALVPPAVGIMVSVCVLPQCGSVSPDSLTCECRPGDTFEVHTSKHRYVALCVTETVHQGLSFHPRLCSTPCMLHHANVTWFRCGRRQRHAPIGGGGRSLHHIHCGAVHMRSMSFSF